MLIRSGCAALALLAFASGAPARAAGLVAAGKSAPAPAAHSVAPLSSTSRSDTSEPYVSQDAAARARMHECAHQWSARKKAGQTGTSTWKEFSATCLVLNR